MARAAFMVQVSIPTHFEGGSPSSIVPKSRLAEAGKVFLDPVRSASLGGTLSWFVCTEKVVSMLGCPCTKVMAPTLQLLDKPCSVCSLGFLGDFGHKRG